MVHNKSDSAPRRLEPGDKVRGKYGATVPDFDDIPLGGWTGTIKESEQFEDQIDYEIEWDRRTLDAMHPVYRKRCERDGLELETMWLTEEDLEPDDGTPSPIEQPTAIKTPPLSERDQDDRVRMALGLTHDDPIPEISLEALHTYHRYLTAKLKFPFTAYLGEEEVGPFSRKRATMTVTSLLDPMRKELGVEDGLVCECRGRVGEIAVPLADIEVGKKNSNLKLISDYAYWFHSSPFRDESGIDPDDEDQDIEYEEPPTVRYIFSMATLVFGFLGCILGATIGAALRTINGAGLASMIGGIPLGVIGALMLGRYGRIAGGVNRLRHGAFLGAFFGSIGGGLLGVVAGLTVVALPWSLLGLIAGMFLGPYVLPKKHRRSTSFRAASLGTCVGILVSAFRHDQARATSGAVSGAVSGLAVGVGLILLIAVYVYLTPVAPMGYDEKDDEHGGGPRPRRF